MWLGLNFSGSNQTPPNNGRAQPKALPQRALRRLTLHVSDAETVL
jgi:hypothetical protein